MTSELTLLSVVPDKPFELHQCYEAPGSVLQKVCQKCGGSSFEVGQGSYFTVIRCVPCGVEACIHDG